MRHPRSWALRSVRGGCTGSDPGLTPAGRKVPPTRSQSNTPSQRNALPPRAQCDRRGADRGALGRNDRSHCSRAVRNFLSQCERVGMVCYVGLVCGTFLWAMASTSEVIR